MFFFNKKEKKSKNSNLKILSGYNFRFRNIGKESRKTIIKYANYFNFDYEIDIKNNFERPFNWLKIQMLIEHLEKGKHEFLLWIDADAFICRYENILHHVDLKKHIFVNNQFFNSKHKTKISNVNYLTWAPNDGVILVRNTKWSLEFFKNVWDKKNYINHHWTDNAAFMDEMGLKTEISKINHNHLTKDVSNKVYFLSGLWNSMPKRNYKNPDNNEISNFYFDPIIIHLAGIRNRDRLKFISQYKHLFI